MYAKCIFEDPSLNSARGTILVVLGPMGAGKSQFSQAVLGESNISVGSPHADNGSIAYCGEDMWLEHGTLDDSIIDSVTRFYIERPLAHSVHRPSCILGVPSSGHERHSKPTRSQDCCRDPNGLLGYDGILRKRETTVLLATYLKTTTGTISRPRSFPRETPVEPTKSAISPKIRPRTSKIQI
ncbi:ABC transporter C family member 5 [Beauveria bassiana]|nr:ABC transporter C family member 5 [Beauveria bassiana]